MTQKWNETKLNINTIKPILHSLKYANMLKDISNGLHNDHLVQGRNSPSCQPYSTPAGGGK